jgi:hypothetical protein
LYFLQQVSKVDLFTSSYIVMAALLIAIPTLILWGWVTAGCGLEVDMALPYPMCISFLEVVDQRQWLGVVNDDRVGILDVKPGRILEHDPFINGFLWKSRPLRLATCCEASWCS